MPSSTSFVLTLDFPTADAVEFLGHLGYFALAVDLSHGRHFSGLNDLARACALRSTRLAVKVDRDDVDAIRSSVDAGASVIQVAGVRRPADLDLVVTETRFPPHGQRGIGRSRTNDYGHFPGGYGAFVTGAPPLVVAIVESREGINHTREIGDRPEIDVVYLGMHDLALDCGRPGQLDDPEVSALRSNAVAAVAQSSSQLGLAARSAADVDEGLRLGARYFLVSQARQLSAAAEELTQCAT